MMLAGLLLLGGLAGWLAIEQNFGRQNKVLPVCSNSLVCFKTACFLPGIVGSAVRVICTCCARKSDHCTCLCLGAACVLCEIV
jgi:hypothetical protein